MPRTISQFCAWCNSAPSPLGPIYKGTVIGFAIFLACLTVCRWQSDTYTAEAQIQITRKSIDSAWPSPERWETILTETLCTLCTERSDNPLKNNLPNNMVSDPALPAVTLAPTATTEINAAIAAISAPQNKALDDHRVRLQIGADSNPLFLNFFVQCTEHRPETAIDSVNQLAKLLTQSKWPAFTDEVSSAETNWHIVPAKMAVRHSAPLSASTSLGCLCVSLVLTTPILLWKVRARAVVNKHEVESLLQTRVLAQLAPSPGPVVLAKSQIVFHRVASIGEWTLITMLLAAVAASLFDTEFANQFIGQPVTALADGIRQLSEITRS